MTNAIANDIRDIKPPIEIVSGWDRAVLIGGILVLLALLALLLWWLLGRKAKPPVLPSVPVHVRARQKLDEALALIAQPKPFCVAVSDAVRWYLEERFRFRAPERTTEEFLRELKATDRLTKEQKESLGRFLEGCDLVKFARYEPGETELRDLHAAAVRLVLETEPNDAKTESQIVDRKS